LSPANNIAGIIDRRRNTHRRAARIDACHRPIPLERFLLSAAVIRPPDWPATQNLIHVV
jgi:hypothetical protein